MVHRFDNRFYLGPGFSNFGAPVIWAYLIVPEGSVLKIESDTENRLAIWEGNRFRLLDNDKKPTEEVLTFDEANRRFPKPYKVLEVGTAA